MRLTRATTLVAISTATALAVAGCTDDGDTTVDADLTEDPVTESTPTDDLETAEPTDAETTPEEVEPTTEAEPTDAESTAAEEVEPTEDVADGGETVEGDGFTITFPTAPSVETVDVPLEDGLSTQATIYQAQIDAVFLGFSHADTPDVGEQVEFDEEQALRDSAQGAADNTGGEVTEAEIIDFQGRTAIDYAVTVPGGILRGIAFFDGTRLYTGQLVAEGDEVDRALLDEMMDSLVLSG